MKKVDVIRAWKDESYRSSLSVEQIAQLPENPAGNLSIEEQNLVSGGYRFTHVDPMDWTPKCIEQ